MRKITKIVAPALIAAMGLGAAIPAQAAAPWHHVDNNFRLAQGLRMQIDQLRMAVARNDRRDNISNREARGLQMDVARLQATFNAYNRDGLSNREARTIQSRIDGIKARLHVERRDRDGRRW